MKTGKVIALLYVPGMAAALLVAVLFSSAVSAADADAEVQSAVTLDDYETKAKFHENAAREMQAKAQEQKRLLEHYEDKSYLYGGKAQDLQGYAHAMARKYNNDAKKHARQAELHRQRAIQLATLNASPPQRPSGVEAGPNQFPSRSLTAPQANNSLF